MLFEIITTEGWLEVMYQGVDSNGINNEPVYNNRPFMSLYFISFIIIGNIFILNLFVGIVIDKFNLLRDKMRGYALMNKDQREWIEAEQLMNRINLIRAKTVPTNSYMLVAFRISNSK